MPADTNETLIKLTSNCECECISAECYTLCDPALVGGDVSLPAKISNGRALVAIKQEEMLINSLMVVKADRTYNGDFQ